MPLPSTANFQSTVASSTLSGVSFYIADWLDGRDVPAFLQWFPAFIGALLISIGTLLFIWALLNFWCMFNLIGTNTQTTITAYKPASSTAKRDRTSESSSRKLKS